MNLAINAISAKRGGALTYLKNMLPVLEYSLGVPHDHRILLWTSIETATDPQRPSGIEYREAAGGREGRRWRRRS
jgi:hypothetical protein